ncbi:MAG: hypothetical protein PWP31_25 [Clostridia bacterium]|nr:hypothetical protein [Clostridia bacterium]
MTSFLIGGLIFGLSAGLSPGPLFTFVITQTLKHNIKEGIKVALSPLATDILIIFIGYFLLSKLRELNFFLGIISLLGGLSVLYLSYESLKTKPVSLEIDNSNPGSLKKGMIINALNPHPYLFWFTVGVPIIINAKNTSFLLALGFIINFYLALIGSKVLIAILVDKSKNFLTSKWYIYVMRILGVLLFIFALLLIKNSLVLLNLY